MDYRTSLQYLERLGNEYLTMKLGLDKVRRLLAELDQPESTFKSVLVAGTNGKGSVSRFLASIGQASYPNCGLYTSPHVENLRQRIQVAGETISEQLFARAFSRVATAVRYCRFKYHPTYFEMLTATAFVAFRLADSKFSVLEVGLGGRLDTTNVVEAEVSVITPIAHDHQHVLGHTLAEIAREKAGIMRPGKPVIVALQEPEARLELRSIARRLGASWIELDRGEIVEEPGPDGRYAFEYRGCSVTLGVYGRHQVENAALAILTAQTLAGQGTDLPAETWSRQLERVIPLGVMCPLAQEPLTMVDGGHNPHALAALARFVQEHTPRPRALVLGMMKDKDARSGVPPLASLFDQVIFVPLKSRRTSTPQELLEIYPPAEMMDDPIEAIHVARKSNQFVLVAGSFYLAGEVLGRWGKRSEAGKA